MKQSKLRILVCSIALFWHLNYAENTEPSADLLNAMHSISSHPLFEYVKELCSEKYDGRLTGTRGYNKSAEWLISQLKKWNVTPGATTDSYLQEFPNPYTIVYPGSFCYLHTKDSTGHWVKKKYTFETDYIPGSTSGCGTASGQVVFVGYGITAPELGYDDYEGLDVRGKIVLMNPEVPYPTSKDTTIFKQWRPYSFHQYKAENAYKHGAIGMLYNYHIANPNCVYIPDLILTYIGPTVLNDLFLGQKLSYSETIRKIQSTLKPCSFVMDKHVSIKNITRHHPEGKGYNVLGMIEGTDSLLKREVIVLSGHLDHLGRGPKLLPGANDNASAVAILMGVAEAFSVVNQKPKRSILLAFFGAEEQGVKGSEFFINALNTVNYTVVACVNIDGAGRGNKVSVTRSQNSQMLLPAFEKANNQLIHRTLQSYTTFNIARPRLDAAHFMWAGIPTLSFAATGMPLAVSEYHKTTDNPSIITPEIMEDIAQLIFIGTHELTQTTEFVE